MNRKLLLIASIGAAMPICQAFAVDANVTALASFRAALQLTAAANLDFTTGADIEFTGAQNTDTVSVATDGTRTEVGTFFIIPNATGQAGQVTIAGTVAEVVDISCDATSVMENATANQIQLSAIEVDTGAGVAQGLANTCTGVGTVATTLTLDGTDAILVGGTIVSNGGGGVVAGDFSTATAADPVVVRVVYQ